MTASVDRGLEARPGAAPTRIGAAAAQRGAAVIGIDVGGTKTSILVADSGDEVLWRRVVDTGTADIGAQLATLARSAVDVASAAGRDVAAVGVAAPGLVESASGVVRLAVNLDPDEMALAPTLAGALGVPCFVEHDTRAAAAWLHVSGRSASSNFAFLSVGTGISAGLVLDGRLHRGATGLAGEVGHIEADRDGGVCACGLRGCLETVASGPAIASRASAAGRSWSPAEVFGAASDGDPVAGGIAAVVGAHLGRAVRALVLAYGVDRVVLGGGVSRAGQPFLEPILAHLERERAASALVRQALGPATVRLLPADVDAGGWGAVTVARMGLAATEGDPESATQRPPGRRVARATRVAVGKEGRDQ